MVRLTIRNSDGTVSQPTALRWADALEKLAHYEDLEEQGRLVVLPVPVGSTVYALFCGEVVEKRIGKFHVNSYTEPQIWAELDCVYLASQTVRWDMAVGKTVFLTRAEAEAALAASDAKGG